jgi:REP element-mobilizing transposase RayT
MSEARKTTADDIYFVTMTIVGWINLFDREVYKEVVVNNLKYCQEKENLEIFAYVIMSNHIHMVCRRFNSDLTELLGRFKSFTSKQFIKEIEEDSNESRREWLLFLFKKYANMNKQYKGYHIWQYTNHPVLLYTNSVIDQKIDYIHNNPVKAGIVTDATSYFYSNACLDSPLKVSEI